MKLKYIVGFILICIFAFAIRFYRVSSVPPALSWDEVSIGYNAWSILKTGRDEHGKYFPLDTFVSYGDYKPTLPVYLTVPFVFMFGLNEISVRLPSVVFGTLAVLLFSLLLFEVSSYFSKDNFGFKERSIFALIAAGVLSLSPWHIQLSRAGWEANIATTLILLGVYLLFLSLKNSKLWIVSMIPFVLTLYTFNSARYASPLILGSFIFLFLKQVIAAKKYVLMGAMICFISVLPILPHLLSPEARLRFKEVNIFTDTSVVETSNSRMEHDGNSMVSKIFDNRRIGYARSYLMHFFDNLEPWFLFVKGDGNPKFSLQDVGQLYIFESILLLYGIYKAFTFRSRISVFFVLWLIASLLPAGVARETPHALRIENSLPVFYFFVSVGVFAFVSPVFLKRSGMIKGISLATLYVLFFSYFLHNYFVHYPKEFSGEWQYGYKDAILFAESVKSKYSHIVLSDEIGRPYMYVSFYTKMDPSEHRNTIISSFDEAGFYNVKSLGKYIFTRSGIEKLESNTLYILRPQDVPASAHVLKDILLLNGKKVLTVFEI
ncbi:MAG: hypothetical protein AAB508_06945 [Patescibacteria group bacterium]